MLLFLPAQDPRLLARLNRHVAHGGAEQHLVMSFLNPTVVFKLTIASCATALWTILSQLSALQPFVLFTA